MGQNNGDGVVDTTADSKNNQLLNLSEISQKSDPQQKMLLDAMAPAPGSAMDRVWDVTKDGISKIPEGFSQALDPRNILPNVTLGAVIGAGTKLILPSKGAVAKVAGGLIGVVFIGKPLVESYAMALNAETMGDMDKASTHLGDTLGGLPVAVVEGGAGAVVGARGMGRLLSTRTATPFVNWKTAKYAALDGHIETASVGLRNVAFDKMGIGGPVMRLNGGRSGFVPPYVLEELARTTKNPDFVDTIRTTEALALSAQGKNGKGAVKVDHKGAREIFDARETETVGTKVRSEGQKKSNIADADNVYDQLGDVRTYYKDVHGRNSIDGQGMKLEATVNYGKNYENAFWDGERMTFGRPGPDSPFRTFVLRKVTGHEVTHGVTQYESNLVYRKQPGALNEHHSDVFGELIAQKALNQTAAEASWLVGEGIWKPKVKGRALRDMRNPGTAYDDVLVGKDPQPAHMKDLYTGWSDNGGVHINSGIPNKAFVLFADNVGGYAFEAPGKIWYEARANAGSTPSFAQFAYHTIEAAKKLGHPEHVPKLEKAWQAVGVTPSLTDMGLTESVPLFIGITPDRAH
ncbi:MAG: M4 family metallopeptidase [Candidatus Obscuribacterales bacterium]|nr:M4 family metallopeptidase [Candidatus Obscuribacterales bacterium]